MTTRFLNKPDLPPFQGANTFFGLKIGNITNESDFGIIGIPMDFGSTFRTGQRFAPQKVRELSRIISGIDYFIREDIFKEFSVLDYGDINVVPGYIDKSLTLIQEHLQKVSRNVNLVQVGGDHLVTLPILRSLHNKFGKIELIHFDAHTDSWGSIYGSEFSHANWLRQAISENLLSDVYQVAIRGSLYSKSDMNFQNEFGAKIYDMQEIRSKGFENVIKELNKSLKSERVYITVDIDAVDPAYAPGTGIPEPGGLSSWEIMTFFRLMNFKTLGMDLVEILPAYDFSDITSILGANLIFQYLSAQAKLKKT